MTDPRDRSPGGPTTGTSHPNSGPLGTGSNAGNRQAAREGKETVRETAKEAGDQIKGAAKEQMSEAKQLARRKAEELTERGTRVASQRIEGFSRALRAAGETLEEEGEGKTGSGLHSLADQLERAQGYVGRQDFHGLVGDTERLARRNPELFLAGAYAAGILIGRFLRSSRPEPQDDWRTGGRYEPQPTSGRALPPAYGTGSRAGSPGVTP